MHLGTYNLFMMEINGLIICLSNELYMHGMEVDPQTTKISNVNLGFIYLIGIPIDSIIKIWRLRRNLSRKNPNVCFVFSWVKS